MRTCVWKTVKVWKNRPFVREIPVGVNHRINQPPQQETSSLNWGGRRWDLIKESCKWVLFSRKGKKDPEGNSEIIKAMAWVLVGQTGSHRSSGDRATQSLGVQPQPSCGGDIATPVSLEGRTLSQRGLFSAVKFQGVCRARSWTHLGPITPFFLSCFLLLEWESLSYPSPIIVFGSIPLVWFHRLIAREEFCLWMNPTSNLSHIWVRYLDKTLDFRL